MIVGAHQPHFLPWLGYLDKLAKSDVFVVMDDLQYEAGNFQNRNRLKLAGGPAWMTVPLVADSQTARLCDRRIDNTGRGGRHHWQHRIRRSIEIHYGRAPFFDRYAAELEDVLVRRWDSLVELDLQMLDLARRWFGITTPIIRASSLELTGAKTDRILAMCEALGANIYLSGKGGSYRAAGGVAGYLDTDQLSRAGIATAWQTFAHPQHAQRYPHLGFVSHLGFLDCVLNCGPDAGSLLGATAKEGLR